MRIRHTCATCAHNGQCADLPHCGGLYWEPDEEHSAVNEEDDFNYDDWYAAQEESYQNWAANHY